MYGCISKTTKRSKDKNSKGTFVCVSMLQLAGLHLLAESHMSSSSGNLVLGPSPLVSSMPHSLSRSGCSLLEASGLWPADQHKISQDFKGSWVCVISPSCVFSYHRHKTSTAFTFNENHFQTSFNLSVPMLL